MRVTLTQPGARTLTATYAGAAGFAGSAGTAAHTVQSPPAVPSATTSSVEVRDATLGLGQRTDVVVTVRDAAGRELENVTVALSATGSGNVITPVTDVTDKKGKAEFDFSSTEAGTRTLTAVAGGVTIAQQPTVTVAPAATQTRITSDAPDPSVAGGGGHRAVPGDLVVGNARRDGVGLQQRRESCSASVAQGSCSITFTSAGAPHAHGDRIRAAATSRPARTSSRIP